MTRPLLFLGCILASSTLCFAQLGGTPGAFSRMGFGARGMGMGNAMTAVTSGDIVSYYNPATIPWGTIRNASASFGLLSLDRRLNFINFSQPLRPMAGISAGIINAGVSEIDGRDSDGEPTGPLRTSENQMFLGFAVRFPAGFSLGINLKLYYYHLYTDLNSTTAGLDLGGLYAVNPSLTLGFTIRDINSKYKWDTAKLYGAQGSSSEDLFPLLYTLGVAYQLPDSIGLLALDVEASNVSTLMLRAGAEVPIIPELSVRAGIDRVDLKETGMGVRPSFGFTIRTELDGWTPALSYAFLVEPFAPSGMHLIALTVIF